MRSGIKSFQGEWTQWKFRKLRDKVTKETHEMYANREASSSNLGHI
jgi:hypothetical protein